MTGWATDAAGYEPAKVYRTCGLWVHGCGHVEAWDEAASGPISEQGCDVCEGGPDGTWRRLFVESAS